ncbi:MAG: hypothetical protein GYA02_16115 [Clostridiaceae bacterium]|nr:hypothetical protein [Clostridiaceae bacterium]
MLKDMKANKIIRYWDFNQGIIKEYRLMYFDLIIDKITITDIKEKYNDLPIEDFYS